MTTQDTKTIHPMAPAEVAAKIQSLLSDETLKTQLPIAVLTRDPDTGATCGWFVEAASVINGQIWLDCARENWQAQGIEAAS